MWFVSPKGQGDVTTTTSPGISAYFVNQSGAFTEDVNASDPMGCTITYEYDPGGSPGGVAGDAPVPASGGRRLATARDAAEEDDDREPHGRQSYSVGPDVSLTGAAGGGLAACS